MTIIVTVSIDPNNSKIWHLDGSVNLAKTTEKSSCKIKFDNGLILFEGDPLSAIKWVAGMVMKG